MKAEEESNKSKLVLNTAAWIIIEAGVTGQRRDLKNKSWLWEILIFILVLNMLPVRC